MTGRALPLPRVGLTVYREPASWAVWRERADLLPAAYADAVADAGGVALLLPPPADAATAGPDIAARADAALAGLHGLVLTGGADVDPARYGHPRDPRTGAAHPDRDEWELALARAVLDRGLPLLAICRGLQVLNVALGGTLHQHLPDVVGHDGHCPTVGRHARHEAVVEPGSLLAAAIGTHGVVPTHHHQAVDTLAPGLEVVARAEDGTIEAVERREGAWTVGVQWHPEVADGHRLFAAFVAACRPVAFGTAAGR